MLDSQVHLLGLGTLAAVRLHVVEEAGDGAVAVAEGDETLRCRVCMVKLTRATAALSPSRAVIYVVVTTVNSFSLIYAGPYSFRAQLSLVPAAAFHMSGHTDHHQPLISLSPEFLACAEYTSQCCAQTSSRCPARGSCATRSISPCSDRFNRYSSLPLF